MHCTCVRGGLRNTKCRVCTFRYVGCRRGLLERGNVCREMFSHTRCSTAQRINYFLFQIFNDNIHFIFRFTKILFFFYKIRYFFFSLTSVTTRRRTRLHESGGYNCAQYDTFLVLRKILNAQ